MGATTEPGLVILADFKARPGERDRLVAALTAMIAPSESEAGCIGYRPMQDPNDEDAVAIVERWVDEAALEEHFETPHFKRVAIVLEELLAEPFKLTRLAPIPESASS
ncbi:MAG TPA: putative quinol monooxygenase [Solirubrobacterales bacterium]